MVHQSFIVVVGIVAATHNLVGDGETFREGIIYHLALFIWIDIHVATVSSAVESLDGTVFQSFTRLGSVPSQFTLDICFHWLEIQVDEVRIYGWSVFQLGREIEGTDILVRRIEPVDGIGKVQFLCIVLHVSIEFLELVHEVIVL